MLFKRDHSQEDHFLQRAVQGDENGFEYLVHAYRDLAYTIALKIVMNREDAEEVVQDAFMKAFGALGEFRRASKFSTWLYRIVYNTAITRMNARKPGLPAPEEAQHWPQSGPLEQADRKRYIDLALYRLTEDERVVITLFYLGEKSVAEISEILDLKKSAVKMRLLRGRKNLKEELERLLPDETHDLL